MYRDIDSLIADIEELIKYGLSGSQEEAGKVIERIAEDCIDTISNSGDTNYLNIAATIVPLTCAMLSGMGVIDGPENMSSDVRTSVLSVVSLMTLTSVVYGILVSGGLSCDDVEDIINADFSGGIDLNKFKESLDE